MSGVSLAFHANFALAHSSQILPRINPALVPITPFELHGIFANRCHLQRLHRSLIHLKQSLLLRLRHSREPSRLLSLFMTRRARTGIPQPCKRPHTLVPVLPVDLDASALGL